MPIQLSSQQAEGLDKALAWYNSGDPSIFRLFGPAGTGKTTCLEAILAAIFPTYNPLDPEDTTPVEVATFTAKAASVVRSKGTRRARTIHSLIYRAFVIKDKITGEEVLRFSRNPESDLHKTDLLVLDECSMINEKMATDILSYNVPILVLGDPAQLPPVFGEGYFTNAAPDHLLTEIHRQAADNPIVALATSIRQQAPIPSAFSDSRVRILPSLTHRDPLTSYDQIICGTNRTRRSLNAQTRALLFPQASLLPVPGDKLVCLRNDHNIGLLNGVLYRCISASEPSPSQPQYFPISVQAIDDPSAPVLNVDAHTSYFLDPTTNEGKPPFDYAAKAAHFDFGYAITCHKSQGSQWSNILVYNEASAFRNDAHRWLYTAVTRASESLTLLL
jgi:exodeoxyribonuclease-5